MKREKNIQELWNSYRRCNMCIMGKLEEDRETEEIFEVIKAENFPTFMTDTKPQLQEAQRTSSMINQKKKIHI